MTSTRPWSAVYEELGLNWQQAPTVPEKTLSHYVRDHAAAMPDREALVFATFGITYSQLNTMADRLAHALSSLGVQKGDVVGIHLPNVPQYIVGFVAAARIGAKVTSLSPLQRAPELGYQIDDAGVKVLLSLDQFLPLVQAAAVGRPTLSHVIVTGATDALPGAPSFEGQPEPVGDVKFSAYTSLMSAQPETPVPDAATVHDVLYLQYTGGTTGSPKGAQLSPYNLFCNNLQVDLFYGYRIGEEVIASAFPFFHIGGAAVLMNGLRVAATNILVPDPRNLDAFIGEMAKRPPTVLAAVPALFQMLCANEAFAALDFSKLRVTISGGSPFSEAGIAALGKICGTGIFYEVYGMTETSPVQTINPAKRLKPGFVGIPVPGTDLRIVDPETGTKQMPTGEPGEVIVTGPQVMSGYFNRPKESATALREHDGKIWMHTGDVGFLDEEGYLKICDRKKDMLIVGGYKVFSAEVESKIASIPEIAMCAVVGQPDESRPGNEIVCLFAQKSPGAPDDDTLTAQLTSWCREHMSPYKVPKKISFVTELPLTSVGKVDKIALRKQV